VKHTGTHLCPESNQFGCSSDGDIYIYGVLVAVLEIKCKYADRDDAKVPYPLAPVYYFNQKQANLDFRKQLMMVFYNFTINYSTIELESYDEEFCQDILKPSLRHLYFTQLLPEMYRKHCLKTEKKTIVRKTTMNADAMLQ
jgi:hypothetical protein